MPEILLSGRGGTSRGYLAVADGIQGEGEGDGDGAAKAVAPLGQTIGKNVTRCALRLLWSGTFLGFVSLVVLIHLLHKDKLENRAARKGLWVANVVVASVCTLIMICCTMYYLRSLRRVIKGGCTFKDRGVWDVVLNVVLFVCQCVNCVFYLVPNAMVLLNDDGKVKATSVAWSFFVRLTMWNIVFLILVVKSGILKPPKNPERGSREDQEGCPLVDAPCCCCGFLIVTSVWIIYEACLVVILLHWIEEAKTSNASELYVDIDMDPRSENVLCEDSLVEEFAVIIIFVGLALYQGIGSIYLFKACRRLAGLSHYKHRWTNITLRYHVQHVEIINWFVVISFVAFYFLKRDSCVEQVLLCFGYLPAEFLMTVEFAISCIVMAPETKEGCKNKVSDLNAFSWKEPSGPGAEDNNGQADNDFKFSFETALKTWLWSWGAYNYDTEGGKLQDTEGGPPQAMDLAMDIYKLTDHQYVVEDVWDSHVLIAWSDQTVVVSFRGTDSCKNTLTDLKAWMASYPFGKCMCCCCSQPAVHAGFSHSWRETMLQCNVVSKVREIVVKKNHHKSRYKIIVTGHSLGGAMAVLAAYDIAVELENEDGFNAQKQILCYTFGAPRVGNDEFRKEYDDKVPNTWQMINDIDVVANAPAIFLFPCYRRVGHKVIINKSGDLIVRPAAVEYSMKGRWTFLLSIFYRSKHRLDQYKESLISILNGKGMGLKGGDVAAQQILCKEERVLKKVYSSSCTKLTCLEIPNSV